MPAANLHELGAGQRPPVVVELAGRCAGLAYSTRKEYARQVAEAKTDSTRERRIAKILDVLS